MYKILTQAMRGCKIFCLALIIILNSSTASSQTTLIQGVVTSSDDHKPLTGVTVMIQGTTTGVTTGANGKYTIHAAQRDTLIFTSLGYMPQKIEVTEQLVLNVVLDLSETAMDQVVIVGYGTQKKATVTGSIASIKGKEIKTISTANLVTGLAGKLPGLRVTQRTGEPGSYTTARLQISISLIH